MSDNDTANTAEVAEVLVSRADVEALIAAWRDDKEWEAGVDPADRLTRALLRQDPPQEAGEDCPECGDTMCRCGVDWTAAPPAGEDVERVAREEAEKRWPHQGMGAPCLPGSCWCVPERHQRRAYFVTGYLAALSARPVEAQKGVRAVTCGEGLRGCHVTVEHRHPNGHYWETSPVEAQEVSAEEWREGYAVQQAALQARHNALLTIWRALAPDGERKYATFGDDVETVVQEVLAALARAEAAEAEVERLAGIAKHRRLALSHEIDAKDKTRQERDALRAVVEAVRGVIERVDGPTGADDAEWLAHYEKRLDDIHAAADTTPALSGQPVAQEGEEEWGVREGHTPGVMGPWTRESCIAFASHTGAEVVRRTVTPWVPVETGGEGK